MKNINQTRSQKKIKWILTLKYPLVMLILLSIGTTQAFAQKERAFVHGKIVDQSSIRAIITSTITIYKQSKKVGEISNKGGNYEANLIPGIYDIEVSSPGFHDLRKEDIKFMNGDSIKCDFVLITKNRMSLDSSPIEEIELQDHSESILNREASIDVEIIIVSRGVEPSLLINKSSKKLIKKAKPRISPAKYAVYRNKEAKSPFRYPVAKIPMVTKNDALASLIYNVSEGKLPKDESELKEIIIEDLVNSLDYNYTSPESNNKPFSVYTELFPCPWNDEKRLLHIGIQAIGLDSITGLTETDKPMAEDVNINVEFNPAYVTDYRLVGYEDYFPNLLSHQTDPSLEAMVRTGQSLTAIYEFTPTQNKFATEDQKLLYQNRPKTLERNNELGAVQIFYRAPSARKNWKVKHSISRFVKSSDEIEEKTFLAVTIAEIAMRLKESPYIKSGSTNEILKRLRPLEELTEQGNDILQLVEAIQKLESEK